MKKIGGDDKNSSNCTFDALTSVPKLLDCLTLIYSTWLYGYVASASSSIQETSNEMQENDNCTRNSSKNINNEISYISRIKMNVQFSKWRPHNYRAHAALYTKWGSHQQHQVLPLQHKYHQLDPKSPEILKIYQILYQACPYIKFAHFTSNQAIFEEFES